jgi:hypothetical protein
MSFEKGDTVLIQQSEPVEHGVIGSVLLIRTFNFHNPMNMSRGKKSVIGAAE